MSGIFGFFCKDRSKENSQSILSALKKYNLTYGREKSDCMIFENCGIGCCIEHLSDEFSASEPILHDERTYAVIDALIFNRNELLNEFSFEASISDEALIFELIRAHGYDILKKVNGDFAGAVYDGEKNTWTLFRDHMGVRPLFFYSDGELFAFSTDIRGLTSIPNADTAIDKKQFYLYMMGCNALSPVATEFEHIRCVPPASYFEISIATDRFEQNVMKYWRLGQKKLRFKTEKEYQNELRRIVEDAVKKRLDAVCGAVGGEFSGGLDSSVIDILISRSGREAKFFSWSLDPKIHPIQPNDERLIIEEICEREHISCTYLNDDIKGYSQTVDKCEPPYINTKNIGKAAEYFASIGIRAVFSGHGGDEGVSHRANQLEMWHYHEYLHYFKEKWQETDGKDLRILRTLKHIYSSVTKEYVKLLQPWEGISPSAIMLDHDFYEKMKKDVHPEPLWFPIDPKAYIEQGGSRNRLDNIAVQGAEHGVRYLVPFLDHRVIDYALSIPRWLYRNKNVNRFIFREAFRDIMPDSLYRLNTKETPSMKNYVPKKNADNSFESSRDAIISRLDVTTWEGLLNLDMVKKCLIVPKNVDEKIYYSLAFELDRLYFCLMLQNLQNNKYTQNE